MKKFFIMSCLGLALSSCQSSTQILEKEREFLESQFQAVQRLCQQWEQDKFKADHAFQHSEGLKIKHYNDAEFGLEGFWPMMKSPANTMVVQSSFCGNFKWNHEDKTLFQDSLLPGLMDAVNPNKPEKYRLYAYEKDASKFWRHLVFLKHVAYLVLHEQLLYQKPQAKSGEAFKTGVYKTRLYLYKWPEQKLLGTQTLKIENSDNVSYSPERYVEVWDEDDEYVERTLDLGDEAQRIRSALEMDLNSRCEDQVLAALSLKTNKP